MTEALAYQVNSARTPHVLASGVLRFGESVPKSFLPMVTTIFLRCASLSLVRSSNLCMSRRLHVGSALVSRPDVPLSAPPAGLRFGAH